MSPQDLAAQGQAFLVADPVLAIFALGVWGLSVVLLRRRWGRWPLPRLGPLWQQILWGGGLAAGALALALLPAWLGGGYDPLKPGFAVFHYARPIVPLGFGWHLWGFFLLQAAYEELVFRALGVMLLGWLGCWLAGLVLKPDRLRRDPAATASRAWERWAWYYSGVSASLLVALAFAWVHRFNPNLTGLGLTNIALAGWALGLLCWWQGHPLGAWAMHWIWNAGIASLGLPVSGILVSPPLVDGWGTVGARPGWFTGGAFGPEGSLPAVLALGAACVVLLWRMHGTAEAGDAKAKPATGAGAPASAANSSEPPAR